MSPLSQKFYTVFLTAFLLVIPGIVFSGSISGLLIDTENNVIQEPVRVGISRNMQQWDEQVSEDGHYSFADLQPETYYLRAEGAGEDSWFYMVYYPGVWRYQNAEWVELEQDEDIEDVNIRLYYGGRISGAVTPGDNGEFDPNTVNARLFFTSDDPLGGNEPLTDFMLENPGAYSSISLPPGTYIIKFSLPSPDMHVPMFFGGTWEQFLAEKFTINEQELTEGIDAELPLGGGVTGIITAEGNPMPWSFVIAFVEGASPMSILMPFSYGSSDQEGIYRLYGLPEGECILQVMPSDQMFARQWYDGSYDMSDAAQIRIESGEMTENIDVDLERGILLSGTVTGPDGEVPEDFDGLTLEVLNEYGVNEGLDITWDEQGLWEARRCIIPRIHALKIDYNWGTNWTATYLNGAIHCWDAEWMYFAPQSGFGVDIELSWGGTVVGVVIDPEGFPVLDVVVKLHDEYGDLMETRTDIDGLFSFDGVPVGDYRLTASLELVDGVIEDMLYPLVCNGGAVQLSEAESFVVEAQQTRTIDMQFIQGGLLHIDILNPDGEYYDLYEDNCSAVAFPIRDDGLVFWDVTSYPDDPPFAGEEGADIILPPGNYTAVGIPVFGLFDPHGEIPVVRRTFYGGSYALQGARFFDVSSGETTEETIEMSVEGYMVSGWAVTDEGVSASRYPAMKFLVDTDGLVAAAFLTFFDTMGEGIFFFNGIPDGSYYLMANVEDECFAVTTWYPDFPEPGMKIENVEIPEETQTIVVDGDVVAGLELTLQTAENLTEVPHGNSGAQLPYGYRLHRPYPNPFNDVTHILFTLPAASRVSLKLYDLMGRKVANIVERRYTPGTHHVLIDAKELPGGVYFIKMNTGNWDASRKVVLVK
ncbi:carboxypeptidase regulatory-like domain-containing protein [bacterium]|nr:carboxypeptidase regulatory-like domain-containing protein [bacterium]